MKIRYPILGILFLVFSRPIPALAYAMDYYTYNGFSAVVGAFQKIALIFSDSGYLGLFITLIVIGIFFGFSSFLVSAATGGRGGPLSWALPIFVGVAIYHGMVLSKGTLHIYDPVRNQSQSVGGLPDGVVVLAGTLNLVERGLVDITSTAADPMGFQQQAGGVGFDMLYNVHSKGILLADQYLHQSLQKYIRDCVYFELRRPGATLTINQLASNTDFLPLFVQAGSPAIFTVYYEDDPSNLDLRRGTTMTCADAIVRIQLRITNPNQYENATRGHCATMGFDPAIPAAYTRCQAMFSDLATWFEGAAFGATQVFRQTVIAREIANVVSLTSPDTGARLLAARDAGTGMIGAAIAANEWIPIIRAVATAIAIGMIPYLVVFLPTPLCFRVLSLIAGLFIWLSAWGITDAVVHQFAIDYGFNAFEEVRRYQLGLTAVSNFGSASLKTLAAFGAIRWSGLTLATVITGILIRFGGHAVAQLAGQITGGPHKAGEKAGEEVATPEGQAKVQGQMEAAPPVMTNAARFDFDERITARANQIARGVGAGGGLGGPETAYDTGMTEGMASVGSAEGQRDLASTAGTNVREATSAQSYMSLGGGVASHRAAGKTGVPRWEAIQEMKNTEYARGFAQSREFQDFASDHFGGDMVAAERFSQRVGLGKHFGDLEGYEQAYQGAKTHGFSGDIKDFASFQSAMRNNQMFTEATVQKEVADRHFGGDTSSMFRAQAAYHNEQAAAMLKKLEMHGFDPTTAAQYKGHIQALTQIGQAQGYDVLGDSGIITSESGKEMNEAAKFLVRMEMAQAMGMMRHNDDMQGFLAYLKQSHGQDEVTLNAQMAAGLNRHMSRAGYQNFHAHPGDKASFAFDSSTGKIKMAHARGGGKGETFDKYELDVGLSKWKGTRDVQENTRLVKEAHGEQKWAGRNIHYEDLDKRTVDHGVYIGSAMQMALARDPDLARFVSDHATNKYKPETFDANVAATAKDLANDVGGFLQRRGASLDYAQGSVGFTVYGTGTIGVKKSDNNESVDLLAGEYDRIIRQSVTEAKEQGLGIEETKGYVSGKVGDFTQIIYDQARNATSKEYGVNAPTEAVKEGIKRIVSEESKRGPN
ncbi:MAG: conjugal transfer protein TraG N-terminal domain-containing protein [Candidatus Manganitrophaceae bacterium]